MTTKNEKTRQLEEYRSEETFHRHEWLVQRTGWALLAVFIIAGCAGVFGNGPLSHRTLHLTGGTLDIDRFVRREASSEWTLRDLASPGPQAELVVRVSADFVERYRVVSIVPEPRDEALDGADVVFRFDANRAIRGIVFNVEPQHAGWNRGEFRVAAGPSVSVEQLVYP